MPVCKASFSNTLDCVEICFTQMAGTLEKNYFLINYFVIVFLINYSVILRFDYHMMSDRYCCK